MRFGPGGAVEEIQVVFHSHYDGDNDLDAKVLARLNELKGYISAGHSVEQISDNFTSQLSAESKSRVLEAYRQLIDYINAPGANSQRRKAEIIGIINDMGLEMYEGGGKRRKMRKTRRTHKKRHTRRHRRSTKRRRSLRRKN